jgi:hypothetical protein
LFQSFSNAGRGVAGIAQNATGNTYGGFFSSLSVAGYGVYGQATAASGTTYGVYGKATSPTGYGIYSEGNLHSTGIISGDGSGLSNLMAPNLTGVLNPAQIPVPLNLVGSGPETIYALNTSVSGRGISGYATIATGFGVGTFGRSDADSGTGVYGFAVHATGATHGLYGQVASTASGTTYGGVFGSSSPDGHGVYASVNSTSGVTTGAHGVVNSISGRGVFGEATATTGIGIGVYGKTMSVTGKAVFGEASATTGLNFGVYGSSGSSNGTGVLGEAISATGATQGIWAKASSTIGYGVFGQALSTSGGCIGVVGTSASTSGTGVYGEVTQNTGTSYGVYGQANLAASGFSVYANGDMGASGVKPFRIDYPTDPENKYLLHYASESPMPQNFYSGNVRTDANGLAWVELPSYFEDINTNYKYQLTVMGRSFAQAIVWDEIKDGRFQIKTNQPNIKVSWRIEADRNDLYVRRKQPKDIVEKQGREKGTYQHPELYGFGPERGMNYQRERVPQAAKPKAK